MAGVPTRSPRDQANLDWSLAHNTAQPSVANPWNQVSGLSGGTQLVPIASKGTTFSGNLLTFPLARGQQFDLSKFSMMLFETGAAAANDLTVVDFSLRVSISFPGIAGPTRTLIGAHDLPRVAASDGAGDGPFFSLPLDLYSFVQPALNGVFANQIALDFYSIITNSDGAAAHTISGNAFFWWRFSADPGF